MGKNIFDTMEEVELGLGLEWLREHDVEGYTLNLTTTKKHRLKESIVADYNRRLNLASKFIEINSPNSNYESWEIHYTKNIGSIYKVQKKIRYYISFYENFVIIYTSLSDIKLFEFDSLENATAYLKSKGFTSFSKSDYRTVSLDTIINYINLNMNPRGIYV